MTTCQQDNKFLESIISATVLEDAIEWIANNLEPEDVFTHVQLATWALDNGYVESEEE